jgi:molybdate transport system regulatory protein
MVTIKSKVQLVDGSGIALGPGRVALIKAILAHGSISAAARSMNMSYKRAWDLVCSTNAAFKEPLVVTKTGGAHGGGAIVTPLGLEVTRLFDEMMARQQTQLNQDLARFKPYLK